jgi:hypothetical protein
MMNQQQRNTMTGKPKPKPNPARLGIIDSMEAAKLSFTVKNLYMRSAVHKAIDKSEVNADDRYIRAEIKYVAREESKADWCSLGQAEKDYWESQSRSKLLVQPTIRESILESLRANPSKSYEKVAADLSHWCVASTIQKWVTSYRSGNEQEF